MDLKELGIETSKDLKYKDLLKDCYEHSKESKHPTTHNAALLLDGDKVILRGVNNLPPGVKNKKERFTGEDKHIYLNHAERDLVYKAAKNGIKTKGLTMIMPWLPCILCANAVISSGIKKLIIHKVMVERTREYWREELKNAVQIMKEAGVQIIDDSDIPTHFNV
jgi:dCMP deaminase